MAKISLKKDYMDGNVLYGKDLNPNFETIETTINGNDDAQAETNAEVEEALTQLSSDMTQAQTDIGELQEDVINLESGITSGDSATLESAKSYTDTKLQDYAKTTDVPTKISQLENDDNTVKDASYVHTDNNYSTEEKNKLAGLSNYELPVATSDTLGGIKLGNGVVMNAFNALGLAIASASQLGGVKAGDGVEIESDGTLNVTGGSSGDGIPTLVGTQESPIALFNPGTSIEYGLSYISGYTKDVPNGEIHNNYNGLLLYTMSDDTQIIGPDFEDNGDAFSSTKANLVFWFRKNTLNGSSQLSQPFVKYSANEIITNTEQGYVTPKAVYDYVGALTSLNTTDKTSIVNAINELINSAGTPGEDGATFTPSVDDSGNLSWTNDKNLPNPEPVNIKGPKGDTGDVGPQGLQGNSGPAGADGVTPTIGENGNWFIGETDTGKPSRGEKGDQGPQGLPGPTGPGVPTGGTTGQVLSKSGDGDYETEWKDLESSGGGSGIIELIGTDEEPIDFINGMQEEGIYLVSGKCYRLNPNILSEFSSPVLCFITKEMADVASSNVVMRFIFDFNGGPSLETSPVAKGSSNQFWTTYELSPVASFSRNGSPTVAVSTYMFKQYTGLNNSTNISNLQTTDKSSLVAAINELNTRLAALENPTE